MTSLDWNPGGSGRNPCYSATDLAEHYGVCKKTIQNWQKLSGFPSPVFKSRKSNSVANLYDFYEVQKWYKNNKGKND